MMLTRLKTVAAVGVLALGLCGVTGAALGLAREGPRELKKPPPGGATGTEVAAKPARDSKVDEEFTKLRKARLALAKKGYAAAVENLTRTKRVQNVLVMVGKPEEVYNWSIRWLQAERDMIRFQRDVKKKYSDEVAALEAHLQRMTELKKTVTDLSRDLLPKIHVDQAEWYRLEAQLWLLGLKHVDPLAPGRAGRE